MNFLNTLAVWQWALLLAVPPAIIALYFLKLRREPLEVPSTYLWHKSIEDLHVNSPWQRIRQSLLLYLQLLIVALVIVTLLRPGWRSGQLTGKKAILLIDNSASMSATDVSPSRLEDAKRRALALIEELPSGAKAMIISFSDTAHVEQSLTGNRRDLRTAVENIRPSNRTTNIDEALRIAAGLSSPGGSQSADPTTLPAGDPAKLYILSDGQFPPAPGFTAANLDPVFVPIGQPEVANVGIVAFSVRPREDHEGQLQAFGSIENFGAQQITVSVDLLLNGNPIDAAKLSVPPHDSAGVAFNLEQIEAGVLELRLAVTDALAQDNRAWVAVNSSRKPKVLLVTPGNEPLQLALSTPRAKELAEVSTIQPAALNTKEYQQSAAAGAYDLIIYDRCRPEQLPRANTLFIGQTPPQPELLTNDATAAAAPGSKWWSLGAAVSNPQIIDTARNHPLMQWIDMGDVDIVEARPVTPPPGGTRLLDSNHGCLLAIAPREGFEDAVLGFEIYGTNSSGDRVANTNWPIRRSFPTFIYAVLQYLGGSQAALAAENIRPGQVITLKTDDPQKHLAVRTPDGATVPLARSAAGSVHFTDTSELGPYEVLEENQPIQRFTVNLFDPLESNLATSQEKSIQLGHLMVTGDAAYQPARQEIWKWLLVAALAVLLLEWYIYNQRIYV